jgi:dihydrofolate reductase
VDWLKPFQTDDYGFAGFLKTIDALVMGRTTYEQARSLGDWPYGGLPTLVLSSRPLDGPAPPRVERSPSVAAARKRLAALGVRRAWNVGGGRAIASFLAADQVDEFHLFLIPILIGEGLPLAAHLPEPQRLKLLEFQSHFNGVMELRYGVTATAAVAATAAAAR